MSQPTPKEIESGEAKVQDPYDNYRESMDEMYSSPEMLRMVREDDSAKEAEVPVEEKKPVAAPKMGALPELKGKFSDLPEDVQFWLKSEHDRLGPEVILHHLAVQMIANQQLMDRIRAFDALVHTGTRKQRRARAKQLAKKGVNLMTGL